MHTLLPHNPSLNPDACRRASPARWSPVSLGHSQIIVTKTQPLLSLATSLAIRTLSLSLGIVGLVFLGPIIFASLLNPGVWFNTIIGGYFLLACIAACIYFFVKRIALLIFILPGVAYLLASGLWSFL